MSGKEVDEEDKSPLGAHLILSRGDFDLCSLALRGLKTSCINSVCVCGGDL